MILIVNFRHLFALLCLICMLSSRVKCIETVKSRILQAILKDYDSRVVPVNEANKSVTVHVNMYIRNIHKVNSRNMEFSAELTFRQSWFDSRLNYDAFPVKEVNFITITDSSAIWKPDLFFPNEVNAKLHDLLQPNIMVRIYRTGKILFSSRISLTLACPMVFHRYPFDEQSCPIRIASYAYTTDQVKLEWDQTQPSIQKANSLSVPLFTLQRVHNTTRTLRTITGEYTTLTALIDLRRDPQLYVFHVFIPSVLLVLIGWLGMWLHIQDLQARLLLSLLALLGLAGGSLQLNTRLPHVGHPKAIDVWCGMCLVFLMTSLVELVLVANVYGQNPLPNEKESTSNPISTSTNEANVALPENKKGIWNRFQHRLNQCSSNKIDVIARLMFPIAFGIFVIVFWIAYS